jgi:Phytanoyl-CoA dioxygenase (PhyH)
MLPTEQFMSITPLYVNRRSSDDDRRQRIFDGGLFLYSSPAASTRIVDWARELIDAAFGASGDVRRAHDRMDVKAFVSCAGPLKSKFTNDAKTKQLCQDLITAMGCDPEQTYFDLPRLRVAPPGEYLTSGVSYAYKAHRDTWYAHPRQLVNYWVPVFDGEPSHVMSMFIDYFHRAVDNASAGWDYDEWVQKARFAAADNIGAENRQHPVPQQDLGETTDLRIVQNAGDLMLFSTCQLHASARNETEQIRYSFDLRTLHLDDLRSDRGPANIDGRATGSTLKDFLRVSDLKPLDAETAKA